MSLGQTNFAIHCRKEVQSMTSSGSDLKNIILHIMKLQNRPKKMWATGLSEWIQLNPSENKEINTTNVKHIPSKRKCMWVIGLKLPQLNRMIFVLEFAAASMAQSVIWRYWWNLGGKYFKLSPFLIFTSLKQIPLWLNFQLNIWFAQQKVDQYWLSWLWYIRI